MAFQTTINPHNLLNRVSPVIVTGCHRSGTSVLTRILNGSGVLMGSRQSVNNEDLYFQFWNDYLFEVNNLTWYKPGEIKNLGVFQLNAHSSRRMHRLEYPSLTRRLSLLKMWGWKDPRNTFTLPLWLKIFPGAKVLLIRRNGMDVAMSLHSRNRSIEDPGNGIEELNSIKNCFNIWISYEIQLRKMESQFKDQILAFKYEDFISQNSDLLENIQSFLGRKLSKKHLGRLKENKRKVYPEDLLSVAKESDLMKEFGYL